jgi:hypothetical protein
VVTLFSPRTMMTHREKTDTDFFLIREEWIVPENLVHVRRTRQSDPHTNRTRRISDTRVNYIKEPWCLVKKVSLASIFISETHEARDVFTSRKKEIEPSSVKRLGVWRFCGNVFNIDRHTGPDRDTSTAKKDITQDSPGRVYETPTDTCAPCHTRCMRPLKQPTGNRGTRTLTAKKMTD